MPSRASCRRDGGTIALVGRFWEIIERTRFCEHQCAYSTIAYIRAKEDLTPALRVEESCQAPTTDAHQGCHLLQHLSS